MVYVVDDGADYRFLLQQIFTRFLPGCRVQFFDSGDKLYQHVQTEDVYPVGQARPSLILMDLNMPGLGGFQTLKLLKQHPVWKVIPVIMMSNMGSDLEIKQCYDAGANSFLSKPGEFEKLKQLITEICQYWLDLNQLAYS
jgi:CheY-like chemotaxis protein